MSDLILCGKGRSAAEAVKQRQAMPAAEVWTLNDAAAEGSSLHFDVHQDKRFWGRYDEVSCGWCVSPFAVVTELRPRMNRFPLHECHQAFGHAYFECSLDYMLALALLQKRRRQKDWRRIWLPGCDMRDGRHFTFRPGTHFWLGMAAGMGIGLEIPRSSLLLKRVVDMPPVPHGDPEFPHAYGQVVESTGPLAGIYGWGRD
jgi:hypothetical protein